MPTAPRGRNDFKVAVIYALPLEAENVQSVFNKCWEDEDKQYGKAVGDQNSYTTGVIGKYNVVLVHMPSMGSNSAALSAAGLRSSFPEIKLALVVGVCGVVPVHIKIVLGDVLISTAVTQYDFGRQYPDGFKRKKSIEDSLGRASLEIRAFVNMLQTRQNRQRLTRKLAQLVYSDGFQQEILKAKYPGVTQDRLYEASYAHQHRLDEDCDRCSNQLEVCSKTCDELGCEDERLVLRKRHSIHEIHTTGPEPDYSPSIHLGRFGSANTVMKSGVDRDRIAADDEVIAFEMEGAGNKDWQGYAAAMAAACLKVVLKEWIIADQLSSSGEYFCCRISQVT
ncbi:hypothetical protein GJ744_005689 [Endocarpon pusillum]|uniref:Nucleoside phosphorylase domain-containing protein n=1 Tax=Endocarpon pusillum TaxID=364733 RepID=A0A8H7ANY0_9EURO|nr:hypothetical protein GJ744_005689 [Endocarpon pusillum]